MHISYKPLWHTLVERNMRKEDLRIAAGLTTNMIANMGKGKNISMETLVRICEALNCCIACCGKNSARQAVFKRGEHAPYQPEPH